MRPQIGEGPGHGHGLIEALPARELQRDLRENRPVRPPTAFLERREVTDFHPGVQGRVRLAAPVWFLLLWVCLLEDCIQSYLKS